MAVVTNSEKVGQIQGQGYTNVQEFKNAEEVQAASERRIQQIKEGTASPTYTFQNVAGTIAKAGAIGFVIGAGIETMVSYKKWKQGELTDKQYAMEILKAGGNSGITAGATAGIMIPISATITAAGMSSLITIPIAFVVGSAVDNIVAPCFGRGKYAKILNEAKYYQNLEDMYDGLIDSMEASAEHYYQFVCGMQKQAQIHSQLKQTSMQMNQNLQKLYDSI